MSPDAVSAGAVYDWLIAASGMPVVETTRRGLAPVTLITNFRSESEFDPLTHGGVSLQETVM